jgi:hypothetical protein
VDDIRIFCDSRRRARQGLQVLIETLHRRGLNVQSAKTKILAQGEARPLIDGIAPTISRINEELIEELETEALELGPYLSPDKVAILLGESDGPPVEVLERAFDEFFVATDEQFNATLFHYLLNKLGAAGSRAAVDYALKTLRARPEETEYAIKYLQTIGVSVEEFEGVAKFMSSDDAQYDYQTYQLLGLCQSLDYPHADVLRACRSWYCDANRPLWLRCLAISYLGKWGDVGDLEALQARYATVEGEIEKASIVAALARVELTRRNSFYARVAGDGDLVVRAARIVRAST